MDPLYRSFAAVVEFETLVHAAERLHITQPTLSRQIQQLEEKLGSALFDRWGKRLVLNRAGELVFQAVKRCIAIEDKLITELESLADPEVGTIHLGAGLTPSIHLLPPILASYCRAHPRVRFQVMSGSSKEILSALKQREIDLAVVTTMDTRTEGVEAIPLMEDPLLLVASPDVDQAMDGGLMTFSRLSEWPIVVLREGSGLRDLVFELAKSHGVALSVAAETDSLESISRMVQHGIGLSILPASAVREDIQSNRIIALPVDVILPSRTIQLVIPKDRALPAVAMQFIQGRMNNASPL